MSSTVLNCNERDLVSNSLVSRYLLAGPLRFAGGHRHFAPVGWCGLHSHACFELVFHPRGHGLVCLENGETKSYAEGSLVIHPPFLQHNQHSSADSEDLCVSVSGPENVPDALMHLFHLPLIHQPWIVADMRHLCEITAGQSSSLDEACAYRAASLFLELINELGSGRQSDSATAGDRLAEEAERRIASDYAVMSSVAKLADTLQVSCDHLRHVYKRRFGVSIKRRIAQVRIQHACDLLRRSTLPVKTVATMCGFESDRHFWAVFRGEMGLSPGEFRRRSDG